MKIADIIGGTLGSVFKDVVSSFKLDPAKKAELEALIEDNRQIIKLKELELQDKAEERIAREIESTSKNIQAEAQSTDKWTSRARPSFLYVMYAMLLSAIPFSIFFAVEPEKAELVTKGFGMWLNAIPDQLYWLFAAGYLGYTGARSVQEWTRAKRG